MQKSISTILKNLLIIFLFLSYSILSQEIIHNFKIIEVIDGDTVRIDAKFLPTPIPPELKLRIIGIDTPEKGNLSKINQEKLNAKQSYEFLKKLIDTENILGVSFIKWDKYGGRILGDIHLQNDKRISQIILKEGFAVPYDGGKKYDWCKNK